MAEIRWTARADQDVDSIHAYISQTSPVTAARTIESIFAAVRQLAGFPRLGRTVPELPDLGLRELVVPPFRVLYAMPDDDTVQIQAIYRSSRDLRRHVGDLLN